MHVLKLNPWLRLIFFLDSNSHKPHTNTFDIVDARVSWTNPRCAERIHGSKRKHRPLVFAVCLTYRAIYRLPANQQSR